MASKEQSKRTYSQIPHKIRLQLIELIEKENYPLSVAGELLGIKLSTAKLIMSKYKSKGYVTKYKREKGNEEHTRTKKQKKNGQTVLVQSQQKSPKNTLENQLQPEKVSNEQIQPMITIQNNIMGYFPYYPFQIPVYFGWTFPQ